MLLDIPLLFFGFSAILLFLSGEKTLTRRAAGEQSSSRTAGGLVTNARAQAQVEPSSGGGTAPSTEHLPRPELVREKIGRTRPKSPWLLFALSALSLALAISVKWTALAFIVPLGLLFVRLVWRTRLKPVFDLKMFTLFFGLTAALYAGFFALDFWLTEPAKLKNFFENFLNLQGQMHAANLQDLRHPNESRWFEWPWAKRSVFYWQSNPGGVPVAWIYLLGNPFVWWVSLTGLLFGAGLVVKGGLHKIGKNLWWRGRRSETTEELSAPKLLPEKYGGEHSRTALRGRQTTLPVLILLLAAYFANLLPFMPIERAMFLYHYFPALIFSFLILGFVLDRLVKNENARWLVTGVVLAAAAITFLHFAPLSYGLRLDPDAFSARLWLPSWR